MRKLVTGFLAALCLFSVSSASAGEGGAKGDAKAPAESFDEFDPQTYKCSNVIADTKGDGKKEALGVSLIWLHGYLSAIHGSDQMGSIGEKEMGELLTELTTHCQANAKDSIARAAVALAKSE